MHITPFSYPSTLHYFISQSCLIGLARLSESVFDDWTIHVDIGQYFGKYLTMHMKLWDVQENINTDNNNEKVLLIDRRKHILYYFLIPLFLVLIILYLVEGLSLVLPVIQFVFLNTLVTFVVLLIATLVFWGYYDLLKEINKKDYTQFASGWKSTRWYHVANFILFFICMSMYFFFCAFFIYLIGIFNSVEILVMSWFAVIVIRFSHYWDEEYGKELGKIIAQLVIPFGMIIFLFKFPPISRLIDFFQGHIPEILASIILILIVIFFDIIGALLIPIIREKFDEFRKKVKEG